MRFRPFLGRLMALAGPRGLLEVLPGPEKRRQARSVWHILYLSIMCQLTGFSCLVKFSRVRLRARGSLNWSF